MMLDCECSLLTCHTQWGSKGRQISLFSHLPSNICLYMSVDVVFVIKTSLTERTLKCAFLHGPLWYMEPRHSVWLHPLGGIFYQFP